MRATRRILFVSNSQGTAAGLDGDLRWSNYPLLVEERMPELDCRYWMASDLSVMSVDTQFREIVMQHRPHQVVLQCGIIECALRILPRDLRDLLRVLPGGRIVTKAIHDRQRGWRSLLNRLGVRFQDVKLPAFLRHLGNIHDKCRELAFGLVILGIPLLSEQCERDVLPGTNQAIGEYNRAIEELARRRDLVFLEPFGGHEDPTRDSLYLKDSVHFSEEGHRVIAWNLVGLLRRDVAEVRR